ncbi:MAG: twin-arginine translocase TatA/TatE family subunit [Chloroflexi bacterium]|nr:twin-arginine translocase TatA/TatE family subunit [Chloroflexota bacterium]
MKFGPWEIGLILVIILIVFGVGKLPQVGGSMGKALREFRKSQKGEDEAATQSKATNLASEEKPKALEHSNSQEH